LLASRPLSGNVRRTGEHAVALNTMPLIPAQRRLSAWRKATRFVAILVFLLIVIGFIVDLLSGLEVLRSGRSWAAWLIGILALGVLYLLGGGAGEWIGARDKGHSSALEARLASRAVARDGSACSHCCGSDRTDDSVTTRAKKRGTSNFTLERTAGSHSLAAAAQRGRSADSRHRRGCL
jgi:hypothetical protein